MGLLAVGIQAAANVISDQWREYFYCPSMESNVLAVKGQKKNTKKNNNGSDNIITNGSIIAVNDGQCMIVVEQGRIVDVSAEPGEYVFDNTKEPSIFVGGLWQGIKDSFETWKKRVSLAGETGNDQRVYYFNTKEIIGNKYGTANPVPFRVVDRNINLDTDITITCFGEYAYRIQDPILFYKNITGNFDGAYTRDKIDSQLKSELLTALQPAFAKISDMGIRYSAVPGHAMEVGQALNEVLSESWGKKYGITISTFGVSSLKANEEDEKRIRDLQMGLAAGSSASIMAGTLTQATASAMQAAASNTATGPMMAFAGMNMAQQAGGVNMGELINAANAQNIANAQAAAAQQAAAPAPQQAAPQMQPASAWVCPNCGETGNTGKFCQNCGTAKPVAAGPWTCPNCGAQGNTGKFCPSCGQPRA